MEPIILYLLFILQPPQSILYILSYILLSYHSIHIQKNMLRRVLLTGTTLTYIINQPNQTECCGVVGVLMKEPMSKEKKEQTKRYNTEQFLCEGMELLKNRGYDSAGVYTTSFKENSGKLVKYAEEDGQQHGSGCINRVIDEVLAETGVSTCGIAHTRWATCGERADRNSHPHFDESRMIHIVHNGIITNHSEIKNKYLDGVQFSSETDTEIIAQFLAKKRKEGKSMREALKDFRDLAGPQSQWGLLVVDQSLPGTIYTATNGSPLLVGFSPAEDEIFLVSERIAFEKHVDYFFETKDGEVLGLDANKIPQLKQEFKDRLSYNQNPPKVLKQPPPPHKFFFNYEIRQQGTLTFQPDFQRVKALTFGPYLTLIACGSSTHSAYAAQHFFKMLKCFKKVNIKDPAELDPSDIEEDETVVLISQSGQTKDLIRIVQDCKDKKGVTTIGIINVEGSTLARKVDYPIYIKVGRETCVAATKSFFHQVLNLIHFATEVAEQKKSAPMELIQRIRDDLQNAPKRVQEAIAINQKHCDQLATALRDKRSVYLLGMRETLGISKQAALKIKQLNYIHAQAMGACEMKHGPIAMIESDPKSLQADPSLQTVVFLFILDNEEYRVMMNALDQMHSRLAYVVVVTNCLKKIEEELQMAREKFEVDHAKALEGFKASVAHLEEEVLKQLQKKEKGQANQLQKTEQDLKREKERLRLEMERTPPQRKYKAVLQVPYLRFASHLLCMLPIQIFVERMCLIRGINPDYPRNLAKSVTV